MIFCSHILTKKEIGLLCRRGTNMKVKLKSHLYSQFERLKSEVNIIEYVFWWISRITMIYACFIMPGKVPPALYLAIVLNTLATFAVPVFSAIFPQKLLFGRLSFRTQTYIDLFVLFGCFFNNCVDTYSVIEFYDKWLHFFTGFGCVFLGIELLKALFPKERFSRNASLFSASGFSFAIIVIWEIFEFLSDFFIAGSANQGYGIGANFNMLFFKIFGQGAGNTGQYPLFDTMFDIMAAVVGIAVAIILSFIAEQIGKKRKAK